MSEFKITIVEESDFRKETILTATVKNGNWRAWEIWQDSTEEQPLTMNTISNFHDLNNPIKFVFDNWEFVEGELVKNGKEVRLYDSLIDFLSTAISWAKDSTLTVRNHKIILCNYSGSYINMTEESPLNFDEQTKATVTIQRRD